MSAMFIIDFVILSTIVFEFSNSYQHLECSNFSSVVTVTPPISQNTPLLLDFRLLTDEQICVSRRILPKFKKLHIEPASYITSCEQCPQCYLTMPNQFELPLSWTLNSLFVVTRQIPHHSAATDVPIYYVLIEKLPHVPLRNCRIFMSNINNNFDVSTRINDNNFQLKFLLIFFSAAFGAMIFLRCFCIRAR